MSEQHQEFMDKLTPSTFKYKNPHLPQTSGGKHYGVMAQDMQKSELGKALISKSPQGTLQYDQLKATSLALASLAFLNQRVNKLESKKGKKR